MEKINLLGFLVQNDICFIFSQKMEKENINRKELSEKTEIGLKRLDNIFGLYYPITLKEIGDIANVLGVELKVILEEEKIPKGNVIKMPK